MIQRKVDSYFSDVYKHDGDMKGALNNGMFEHNLSL